MVISIKEGFPHSDICGSTIARISPQLFAACHVLHRLLAPRHPPNALITLQITPSPATRRTKPRPARDSAVHLSHSHSYSQTTQLFPDKLVKEHTSPVDAEHRRTCLLEAGPTGRMVEAMRPVVLISMRTPISNARRTADAVQRGQDIGTSREESGACLIGS